MARFLLMLPLLIAVPTWGGDPPRDLLLTLKATPFQRVDRLEGLPKPVQKAVHDLLEEKCIPGQEEKMWPSKNVRDDPAWNALPAKEREGWFLVDTPDIANPGEAWNATDVMGEPRRPSRRLIYAGTSPSLWFTFYEHGGYGRHNHLMVLWKIGGGGYGVRWVTTPRMGERGIGLADLQRIASTGKLQVTEHGRD